MLLLFVLLLDLYFKDPKEQKQRRAWVCRTAVRLLLTTVPLPSFLVFRHVVKLGPSPLHIATSQGQVRLTPSSYVRSAHPGAQDAVSAPVARHGARSRLALRRVHLAP